MNGFYRTCLDPEKTVANFGNARGTLDNASEEFGGTECTICFGLHAKGQGNEHFGRGNSVEHHKIPNLMLYYAKIVLLFVKA